MTIRAIQAHAARFWETAAEAFDDERLFRIVGTMTALLVMLQVANAPRLEEILAIGAAAGILLPRLMHQPMHWFGLCAILAVNHVQLWATLDNHQYLITYWCLAMGTSQLLPSTRGALITNARLLIGLCFLFATVWKFLSGEFIDGTFFHFTLLTDRRFSGFADLVGGVPAEVTAANISAIDTLTRPYGDVELIQLEDSPRMGVLALFLAVWTVAIEGMLAVLFLAPLRERLAPLRDGVLLLFMVSTYPVATVVGFGRVLAVMGLAQSPNRLGIERPLYLLLFLVLPLFRFPFARVFRYVFG
jgi:hypothetical protein